ncbi:hypothetical protein H257_01319 [Aphanomyces astaci]|uniref:Uncharacterized protein n=1 Tax=Aphanomyces astaci TaxID=112090 RepID=W4H9F1_APHAT|nr:hypothetical protein H257_01319 [Aphanomyces astaci]ETV87909.1 hypothetical protein H257_01319 [Aphanomyces astaci]|eukprot:XP_009822772.1 hypothetical protein H257_01319 [Aphanomyces astaci]
MLSEPRRVSAQQLYKVHPGGAETIDDADSDMRNDFIADNKEFIQEETVNAAQAISKWWRIRKLHNRIKSKWTPEHLRKLREQQRQVRIQLRIREIALYIVYLLFLNDYVLGPYTDSSLYYFNANLKRLFMTASVKETQFNAISTIPQVHRWLQGPFFDALYSEKDPVTGDYTILQYGQVVGGISIGQLRVLPQECTSKLPPQAGNEKLYWCYGTKSGHFDESVESKLPFGTGNGSNFQWNSISEDSNISDTRRAFFTSYTGATAAVYPAPAFRVVLPHSNADETKALLASIESNAYMDVQTRAVFVDLTIFNVMLSSVLVLRFAFEVPPSGGVVPTSDSVVAPYADTSFNFLTHYSMLAVALFFLLYFLLLLRATRKEGWPVYRRLETWVQVANSVAYIVMWLLRACAGLDFPNIHVASTSPSNFRSYAFMYNVSMRLAAAVCFLSYVRLILFLDVLPHVNLIVKTVVLSVTQVSSFLFVFGLLVYAYATCYCVVFGSSVEVFSTVSHSYTSLLQSLVGDLDYAPMREASPGMAMLLVVAFTLVAVFVLAHILIAMIIDAYWASKESTQWEQVNLVVETLSYVWSIGMDLVHYVGRVCGVSFVLVEDSLDAQSTGHHEMLGPLRPRRLDVQACHGHRLSAVQKLVVMPLAATHAKLEQLGHTLSQSQLVRSGVDGIRRGTNMVVARSNQITDRLNSFRDERGGSPSNNHQSARRFPSGNGGGMASDAQMKVLQGMIIQLAHQNTKIQQTLVMLQSQVTELREASKGDDDRRQDDDPTGPS